jgi:hypothetical protein
VEDKLAEIAVGDDQNPLLFPGDFKDILIGKTGGIVTRDGLNVMSEMAKVGNKSEVSTLVKQEVITTTPNIEGKWIKEYLAIVTGEAVVGANLFRDLFAGIRDIVGGRSGAYEKELRKARDLNRNTQDWYSHIGGSEIQDTVEPAIVGTHS